MAAVDNNINLSILAFCTSIFVGALLYQPNVCTSTIAATTLVFSKIGTTVLCVAFVFSAINLVIHSNALLRPFCGTTFTWGQIITNLVYMLTVMGVMSLTAAKMWE